MEINDLNKLLSDALAGNSQALAQLTDYFREGWRIGSSEIEVISCAIIEAEFNAAIERECFEQSKRSNILYLKACLFDSVLEENRAYVIPYYKIAAELGNAFAEANLKECVVVEKDVMLAKKELQRREENLSRMWELVQKHLKDKPGSDKLNVADIRQILAYKLHKHTFWASIAAPTNGKPKKRTGQVVLEESLKCIDGELQKREERSRKVPPASLFGGGRGAAEAAGGPAEESVEERVRLNFKRTWEEADRDLTARVVRDGWFP